jgi:hypothetical protein
MTEALVPSATPSLPRAVVIERRLQVLEREAAVQRTTLTATLSQWEQRRTLGWVMDAAKMAGGAITGPTGRLVLGTLLKRLVLGRFG